MPNAIPACFRATAPPGGGASSGSGSGVAETSLATSVYETCLGLAALSWSRAALGLSLRAVLRVSTPSSCSPAASDYDDGEIEEEDDDEVTVAVRVQPWLLWRRRGSKRFRVGDRQVDLAWDLSRARFPPSGSPEPSSRYFAAVVVDGEMAVVAGDMAEEAYRKTKACRPSGPGPVLVSRREHVSMRDGGSSGRGHRTCVTVRGKVREILVDLVSRGQTQGQGKEREQDRADVGMSVSVDGERVLHVRRLRWKFRGSEKVELGGGDQLLVSWDLHNWLFPSRETSPPDAAAAALVEASLPPAHAVFAFRFELGNNGGDERDSAEAKEKELLDKAGRGGGGWVGYVGRWARGDWSESSSNGEHRRKGRQARRLAMESSSSSASVASSSASFASGSMVMDWASPEEAELRRGDGFSLLVYAWKN